MSQTHPDAIVDIELPSDDAIAAILDVVKVCPPAIIRQWGSNTDDAFIMELLVSTLSHALNEDLLVARLKRLQVSESWVVDANYLAEIADDEIARWFELNTADQSKRNPNRLATLIRANFQHISEEDRWRIADLFDPNSSSSVVEASKWLATFPVFERDPLQKKSALILQRLYLQEYLPRDRYLTLPFAIDRHIVRLFLRLGWIRARTEALGAKVSQRFVLSAEEDTALRGNASAVMSNIAQRSRVPHAHLNYTLWQFSRSYCARHDPGCLSIQPPLLGLKADLAPQDGGECLLSNWCAAFHAGTVRMTMDPLHRGDLY